MHTAVNSEYVTGFGQYLFKLGRENPGKSGYCFGLVLGVKALVKLHCHFVCFFYCGGGVFYLCGNVNFDSMSTAAEIILPNGFGKFGALISHFSVGRNHVTYIFFIVFIERGLTCGFFFAVNQLSVDSDPAGMERG